MRFKDFRAKYCLKAIRTFLKILYRFKTVWTHSKAWFSLWCQCNLYRALNQRPLNLKEALLRLHALNIRKHIGLSTQCCAQFL